MLKSLARKQNEQRKLMKGGPGSGRYPAGSKGLYTSADREVLESKLGEKDKLGYVVYTNPTGYMVYNEGGYHVDNPEIEISGPHETIESAFNYRDRVSSKMEASGKKPSKYGFDVDGNRNPDDEGK